jgi:transmembrane sensor
MKELYNKYIDNNLTKQDLAELKNQDVAITDCELDEFMKEKWMDGDIDTSDVSDDIKRRVKSHIDSQIESKKAKRIPLFTKILAYAAAIILPVLIISTYYFYQQNHQLASAQTIFSTGQSERTSVTLPDGTKVSLNSKSRLEYIPSSFNKKLRQVKFSGEAYFQVAKDKTRPFLIESKGLTVKVLGTTFNLLARPHETTAELSLLTGKVMFKSHLSGKSVIIFPNHKVIMDQHSGNLQVTSVEPDEISAWQRNEMVFNNVKISQVVRAIENNYGVKIHINTKDSNDLFTGTLASNDLNGVLKVLELSYNLKASKRGNEITIAKIK